MEFRVSLIITILVVPDLHFWAQAFCSCDKWGLFSSCRGSSRCRAVSKAQAQKLLLRTLGAPRHVGCSLTRD